MNGISSNSYTSHKPYTTMTRSMIYNTRKRERNNDDALEDEIDAMREAFFKGYHVVQCCGIMLQKNTVRFFQFYIILCIILLFGGGLFYALEKPAEREFLRQAAEKYHDHKQQIIYIINNSTQNMTETMHIYEKLQEFTVGFDEKPNEEEKWTFSASVFFAFTIITTIGYGTFTPMTKAGRLFVILYGFIGIPITALSLASISERVLYVFTWLSKVGKDKVEDAFHHFDEDGSGKIEKEEFKAAVKELGFRLSLDEFDKLWQLFDIVDDGMMDLEEFRYAVGIMHADLTDAAGRKSRVVIVSVVILFWFILGEVFFVLVEDWDLEETIYFLFVSLATIGLGDFTPRTVGGIIFLMAFSFVGLGLVTVLIKLLQGKYKEMKDKSEMIINSQLEVKRNMRRLKEIPIFSCLQENEVKALARKAETISPFKEIIKQGARLDSVCILLEGKVSLHKDNSGQHNLLLAPCLLFDPIILDDLNNHIADSTVVTIGKAVTLSIARDHWESLILNAKHMSKEIDFDSLNSKTMTSESIIDTSITRDVGCETTVNTVNTENDLERFLFSFVGFYDF